jgi:hypothetical protein
MLFVASCACRFFIVFMLFCHPPDEAGESSNNENFIWRQMRVRPFKAVKKFVAKTSETVPKACLIHKKWF